MRIFYKKRITDKILDAKFEADKAGKTLEKVELSWREWLQFKREIEPLFTIYQTEHIEELESIDEAMIFGIKVVKEPK